MYDYDDEGVDLKKAIKDSVKEYVQESQAEAQQKEAQSMIAEACQEAGIPVDEFNKFISKKEVFQNQVKDLAHRAAKAKGRKPKHQESDSAFQTSQPSVMGRGRAAKEKWAKGANRSGTDSEVLDMLTDMIGNDPAFKTSHELKWGR